MRHVCDGTPKRGGDEEVGEEGEDGVDKGEIKEKINKILDYSHILLHF